jgi:hypothetical protein
MNRPFVVQQRLGEKPKPVPIKWPKPPKGKG